MTAVPLKRGFDTTEPPYNEVVSEPEEKDDLLSGGPSLSADGRLQQRLDAVELLGATDPRVEVECNVFAVEIKIGAIKHIRLDASFHDVVEGRIRAD